MSALPVIILVSRVFVAVATLAVLTLHHGMAVVDARQRDERGGGRRLAEELRNQALAPI